MRAAATSTDVRRRLVVAEVRGAPPSRAKSAARVGCAGARRAGGRVTWVAVWNDSAPWLRCRYIIKWDSANILRSAFVATIAVHAPDIFACQID